MVSWKVLGRDMQVTVAWSLGALHCVGCRSRVTYLAPQGGWSPVERAVQGGHHAFAAEELSECPLPVLAAQHLAPSVT